MTQKRLVPLLAGLLLVVTAAGCGDDLTDRSSSSAQDLGGPSLEVIADGLIGPTQFVFDGEDLIVAQLNGGENDEAGQIIEIDATGQRRVLYDNLDKPTGVLVRADEIWIMERSSLLRGPREGGALIVVAEDLPNNGRSQGTLTLTPDDLVLFDTSGSHRGGVVRERSGRLWTATGTGEVEEYASGFKHAYAHVFDQTGTLWTTEMSDGSFDGQPPADEVVAVEKGSDHGWPSCVGDNRPVAEFGVSDCGQFPPSLAVFDPGSTPTGIVISPFDPDSLLVSLWVRGQVVSVPMGGDGSTTVRFDGLVNPQHLVVHEGQLYLSEFGLDRIVRLG